MDTEALPAVVEQHPVVRRAVEELKMLAQTNEERERYEARRKWQLDYNTGMKMARLEGEEQGLEIGRQEGRIEGQFQEKLNTVRLLEGLLHRTATPPEQLAQRSLEELSQLIDQLSAELRQAR